MTSTLAPDATTPVAHLTPEAWALATRRLVRKALAEFAHERLVTPTPLGGDRWEVTSDDGTDVHRFSARRRALDHWQVDADSIDRRGADGQGRPLDLLELVTGLRTSLGIPDDVLPVYLEELGATLASHAFRLSRPAPTAAELAEAELQLVEAAMAEGHPCFLANSGRLGFDVDEYHRYAPEVGAGVRLWWVAVDRSCSTFTAGAGVDEDALLTAELGHATRTRFEDMLRRHGGDPARYRFVPVHPWQWTNTLATAFAGEVATRRLVPLGPGDDLHQPQQSIRTFFNRTRPDRHYVKTALSVVNMGFVRGLSSEYMRATPAISDWLADVVVSDPTLAATGVEVLRELAAVGYHHRHYDAATRPGSPYRKMLAALWRESPVPRLGEDEQAATMASLLHVDEAGDAVITAHVERSGLRPEVWVRRYLDAYLLPLLQLFHGHGIVLMPHGENVILVLRDGVPVRVLLKDIGEEVAVLDPEEPLPPDIERIRADVPDELQPLSILTDVLDCFLRFVGALLAERDVLDEDTFWATVAACVADHRAAHPELADRFTRHDLFVDRFPLSRLNGLQLRNNRQMVDLDDPASALQLAGELDNPLARHRPGW